MTDNKELKEIGLNQGENAKKIRENILGDSQQNVAERANTYQQNISRMEKKRELTEIEKHKLAKALGVDVSDIEYFNKDRVIVKVFKDNNPSVSDNSELMFGGESYKIFNPLDKVSELYERISKIEQYNVYLETLCETNNISYEEKKKKILGK